MRQRMERARRQAPPPPRRASEGTVEAHADEEPGAGPRPVVQPPERVQTHRVPGSRARTVARAAPVRLAADLPPVNLAIRVRRPLDDRLADIIHRLRRDGVRTSKVEIIEMLLWELPEDELVALRERLRQFRDWAPRGNGAPLQP